MRNHLPGVEGTGNRKVRLARFLLFFLLLGLSMEAIAQEHSTSIRVELYTKSGCLCSAKAREFFQARGIAFTDYDVSRDPEALRRKVQFDPRVGTPVAVIDGEVVFGFSERIYAHILQGKN